MSLHSTKNPRHTRVFELLRQNQIADDVFGDMRTSDPAPVAAEQLAAFQRTALKSFDRSIDFSSKPRRNDKLF